MNFPLIKSKTFFFFLLWHCFSRIEIKWDFICKLEVLLHDWFTFFPACLSPRAICVATVLFPTPPFPDITRMTWRTADKWSTLISKKSINRYHYWGISHPITCISMLYYSPVVMDTCPLQAQTNQWNWWQWS